MSLLSHPLQSRAAIPAWAPLVFVFALAIVVRHVVTANTDVSWDLTIAEKWLDGARLYIDIIEVNPPATVFLYVAPTALARLLGVTPEIMVDVLSFIAIGLSLWLSQRILLRGSVIHDGERWPLVTLLAAVLMILPGQTFGEREHVALILFMPWLAVAVVRAQRGTPERAMVVAAGVAAGLLVIIKPHFAAAMVFAALAAAAATRSWRPLLALENWIAVVLLAAYTAFIVVAFPQFFSDMMPLLLAVYVPMKATPLHMLVYFATPIWTLTLLMIVWLKRRALLRPPISLLLAASVGFSLSFYVQQKGWPYHSYPMLALALMALALAFVDRWHRQSAADARVQRLAVATVGALLAGLTYCWMNFAVDCSALAAPIRALNPHPKMLALTGDLAYGHPLVRQLGGTWVGRVPSQWITVGVLLRRHYETLDPATDAKLEAYARLDRTMLTEDIARNQPDVILVQPLEGFDWLAWANRDPALAAQMAAYRPYATVDDVTILRRSGGEK